MSKPKNQTSTPWYRSGLKFQCTECGKCCTGQPGYVWVTEEEIENIANSLSLPVNKFKRQYLRQKNNRYALLEKRSQNYDCVFLKDNKCQIYKVRPLQCQTYPWWEANIKSKKNWKNTAQQCEGINDDAPVVPLSEIEKNLRNRAKTTCTFLISQHLHLLRCKSLKTKKLAADLRLAAEAL